MTGYPHFVEIHEEGPREGFQMEQRLFPLDARAAFVDALSASGLKQIQVASFVDPRRVPQMADAPALFAAIRRHPGTCYTGLWLNEQGFDRARAAPQVDLDGVLYFYTSDAFCKQNNGSNAAEFAQRQRLWVRKYRQAGLDAESAYVMTAFGCNLQGEISMGELAVVLAEVDRIRAEEGFELKKLYLADTVGWANPESVRRRVDLVRNTMPGVRVGLHLHDTRGIGMANVLAALEIGIDLFDASVAGLGGCPFSGHESGAAAGNVCTEDLAFLCHELGIDTGIDVARLVGAARMAERIIGRRLDGKLMHSGTFDATRGERR